MTRRTRGLPLPLLLWFTWILTVLKCCILCMTGCLHLNTKNCMTEITNHRNSMRYYNWLVSMILTNIKMISIPFSQFIVSQLRSFTYVFIYRQPTEGFSTNPNCPTWMTLCVGHICCFCLLRIKRCSSIIVHSDSVRYLNIVFMYCVRIWPLKKFTLCGQQSHTHQ